MEIKISLPLKRGGALLKLETTIIFILPRPNRIKSVSVGASLVAHLSPKIERTRLNLP
jgi:hypothetical protein